MTHSLCGQSKAEMIDEVDEIFVDKSDSGETTTVQEAVDKKKLMTINIAAGTYV